MMRTRAGLLMGLSLALGVVLAGCGTGAVTATKDLSAITLSDSQLGQIAKLPPPEQEAARAQKICPVGVGADEPGQANHLGSMGVPVKVKVEGRTVFVCCAGCVADLKARPGEYLPKLGASR